MSIQSDVEILRSQYREEAVKHGQASRSGNYKAGNRAHDRLMAVLRRIRGLGSEGDYLLESLLNDSDLSVVCWSASHSMRFNEKASIAALQKVATGNDEIALTAKITIDLWKKGSLKTP